MEYNIELKSDKNSGKFYFTEGGLNSSYSNNIRDLVIMAIEEINISRKLNDSVTIENDKLNYYGMNSIG